MNLEATTISKAPSPGPTGARPLPHDPASNGALRLAMQRSEPRRLALLLGILAVSLILAKVRYFSGGKVMQGWTFVFALALIALAGAYAIWLLIVVRRATARGVALPLWVWALTVVWECSFPTLSILIQQGSGRLDPLDALTVPAVLLYGAIITLTILRMRPWLCLLAGLTAATGHVVLFVRAASLASPSLPAGEFPFYFSYAVYLFITGVAAAVIAGAVRGYFLSSLREAQATRALDRVHNELDLARSIQMGLLPTEPPLAPGFDIAGWSRPADQTGGDYYDWQTLADGRILISVADATGHGIGPAMVSAVCRAYARAAAEGNGDAGSLLNRLNKLLTADLPTGKFVTFAGVVLRPGTGVTEIFSAGHGPMLLHRAAREGRPARWEGGDDGLDTHGPPFAVDGDFTFESPTQIVLQPGDFLVLPTDGAFEWLDKSENQFGVERLKEVTGAHANKPARQIIHEIDAALRAFAGGTTQQDDVTVVVIKRLEV